MKSFFKFWNNWKGVNISTKRVESYEPKVEKKDEEFTPAPTEKSSSLGFGINIRGLGGSSGK